MSKIYDKTAANFKATTVDAKILDAQKILVRPKGGAFDERINILDVVDTSLVTDVLGKTGFSQETISLAEATRTNDGEALRIKSSLIPHDKPIDQIILPTCGTQSEKMYVGVYIIGENESMESSNRIFLGMSDNSTAWGAGGRAIWNFDKKPFIIPTGYDVELHIARSESDLTPTGTTITNKFLSCYYKEVAQNQGGVRYGNRWYANPGRTISVIFAEKSIDGKINAADRQYIKELINHYSEYDTTVFPWATEGVGGGNAFVTSFRLGHYHCPKGVITKVSTYARSTSTGTNDAKTNGCYLIAKVYKKDGTLVSSQSSKNKVVVTERPDDTSYPTNTWLFDGIITPKKDEVIKFIPSPDGINQVANYQIGVMVDATHTHVDCVCNGDNGNDFLSNPLGNGDRWLIFAKFEGSFYQEIEKTRDFEEHEKKFLKSLYTTQIADVFDNNINNESIGYGNVKAFVVERPYISNGLFSQMKWTTQGTNGSNSYMKITLRDLNGKAVQSLMSEKAVSFSEAGEKLYKFNEFAITDNIGSILCETSTDGVTVSNSSQFRIAVIGNAQRPNADGSEVTNNPFIAHVIFRGKVAETSNALLTAEEKAALQQLVQGTIAVKEITIIDDDANAVSLLSENYEEIEDEGIVLKFEDSLDNNYLMCSEKDLVDATDYLELDVNINCPEELGKKLVRRYLVIDLRNMEDERNIVTVFPENVKWSSQIPVIQANKFYVISFQRFAKDLVVANVELYLAE